MSIIKKIDRYLLVILPIILVITLIIVPDVYLIQASVLIILLILYYFFTDAKLSVYGVKGIRILSIPSTIFVSYTVFIAIPAIFVRGIEGPAYNIPLYFSVFQFYILYPLGLLLGNRLYPIRIEKMEKLFHSSVHKSPLDKFYYDTLIFLLFMCTGIMIIYLFRVKVIPLFVMLSNPKAYLYLFSLREEAMKTLQVTFIERYLFSWLRSVLFPMGIIGSLFLMKVYGLRKYKNLFIMFLALGVLNNSLTIAKAPTASLMLSLIAFYFLYREKFGLAPILISISIIFLFPYIVVNFTNLPENRDPINLLTSMFLRLFYIPVEALYQHFVVFPDVHSFLWGKGTKLFSWLYGSGTFDVSNYVAKIWWKDMSTTGYANAVYIGGFWADFGYFGVLISTFILGLLSHIIYFKTLRVSDYNKTIPYMIIICSTIGIFTFSFVSINITSIVLTKGIIVVYGFTVFLETVLKKKDVNDGQT